MKRPNLGPGLTLLILGCGGATAIISPDPTPAPADDDDSAPDDDDSADDDDWIDPESDVFVDKRYCLDWDTVVVNEPEGGDTLLAVVGMTQTPLLLQATSTDLEAGEITMILAISENPLCEQNLDLPTSDLTGDDVGRYAPPHFAIGPVDTFLGGDAFGLFGRELLIGGDFTAGGERIVNATLSGTLDVTSISDYCEWPLTCFPCAEAPDNFCIDLDVEQAEFYDSELGPLTVVP